MGEEEEGRDCDVIPVIGFNEDWGLFDLLRENEEVGGNDGVAERGEANEQGDMSNLLRELLVGQQQIMARLQVIERHFHDFHHMGQAVEEN